jgi:pimeloyl-ACP methyl ester carboxylesterase
MRLLLISSTVILFSIVQLYAQDVRYPIDDFYHRSIELPIDYANPQDGNFVQYYEITSNFNFNKPTIFFFQDAQQEFGIPGKVDDLAKSYQFFDDFNVLRYQHRGRKYSYIELKNNDGTVNWERAYRVLSSNQVIEDIEQIRKHLFKEKPDAKILIYGRSGGGYLVQQYLAKHSHNVHRAFIGAAPNPIILKQLGHPESKYFYNTLNEIDTTLHAKVKEILKKNIVPDYQLLWILKGIPYASKNPLDDLKNIIEELYEGKKILYESYLQKKGFDFSKKIIAEEDMNGMNIGSMLRPVEVSAEYMLDPDPEFIDPFYVSLKKLNEPYLRLIKEKKVEAPTFPPLEKFNEVETEIFYLAGKQDHVSDYRIGIELGKYFKNYDLFIADDNHKMTIHKECYPLLRNTFFKYGIGSKELQEVRNSLNCKEWKQK